MYHACCLNYQLKEKIANSKRWAQSRGLLRKNEVHGAEEWRIPLEETYALSNVTGTSSTMTGTMELEDMIMHVCANHMVL